MNCGSEWPAFVPVHDPTHKAYQGIKGTRTHSACYETDRMGTQIPVTFMHVAGLYDLFISKVVYPFLIRAKYHPLLLSP